MARGLRTGRHRGWGAITLAACILAHIVPALFAIVGGLLLIAMEMLPQRIRPEISGMPILLTRSSPRS